MDGCCECVESRDGAEDLQTPLEGPAARPEGVNVHIRILQDGMLF